MVYFCMLHLIYSGLLLTNRSIIISVAELLFALIDNLPDALRHAAEPWGCREHTFAKMWLAYLCYEGPRGP